MPPLADLAPLAWALLGFSAVIVGLSKTALPGGSTISVAIFAAVLPAKASTGALLLTLMIGDVFALLSYRRHADWATLIRLVPAVAVGLGLGALFLAVADDGIVRRVIGTLLLLVIIFSLWQRSRIADAELSPGTARIARAGYGALGGFTTMVANAAGPVMSMYFLVTRFPVLAFLGTAAWFFAVINAVKVPIAVGLGLITVDTLWLVALLAPCVVIGAFVGRYIAKRITQGAFNLVVIIGTLVGALYLLLF